MKCILSAALQRLFRLKVWSYQPLPRHHQVYLHHCNSVAVWNTGLVITATAWTLSSVSPALQLSGCLDYKSGHMSHCLDTMKCILRAALQWLFGLQIWSYQPLPGHHQVYLQSCTSVVVCTTSLLTSPATCTSRSVLNTLQICCRLDNKFGYISHCLNNYDCCA
ncbi:hypothetical protein TNCT_453351 [Trichonephila clavata]|uniref:Uncharacterized protein n=1 Tax=Trichonephila clavata TaxID=2740835 RepID=A0A8X6I0Z0_TRICU|nr:hypothetical protein TNCT_453351 [Trichonephila clavata]